MIFYNHKYKIIYNAAKKVWNQNQMVMQKINF